MVEYYKHIGLGVTAACTTLLFFYLYKQHLKKDKEMKKSPVRKLMSKYKTKTTEESAGNSAEEPYKPDILDGLKIEDTKKVSDTPASPDILPQIDLAKAVQVQADIIQTIEHTKDEELVKVIQEEVTDNDTLSVKVEQQTESSPSDKNLSENTSKKSLNICSQSENEPSSSESSNKLENEPEQASILCQITERKINGGIPDKHELVKAVVMATDDIHKSEQATNQEVIEQCFNIPKRAIGKIIGKQGQNIKGLQRNTGARLQFPDRRTGDAPTQKLFVKGTLRQVSMAVEQLVALMPADSMCHELISWTPEAALEGDLKPIELIENTTCVGRGTHVTSPQNVWVQVCRGTTGIDYTAMLASLTDNITDTLSRKMYDLKSAFLQDAKQGSSCAVMFEGRAYRASVITPARDDNKIHQVRMVDFGTPHSFTELYQLSPYYTNMPALAVQCRLAHVNKMPEDSEWPVEAAEFLEEILRSGFVKIKVIEEGQVPAVELYLEDPSGKPGDSTYINRELVYNGYAQWNEEL